MPAYVQDNGPVFLKDGQASSTKNWLFTDDDFLKVVSLPMLAGTTLTAPRPRSIAQSEAIARYGTDQVVGRTLTIISRGIKRDFTITGVFKDVPKNSSLKVEGHLAARFQRLLRGQPEFLTKCWGCQSGYVFLKMKPGTDVKAMEAQMPAWEKRNIPDEPNGDILYNAGTDEDWHFVNVKDIHLGKAQDASLTPGNDRRTITTFAIIALLILGMAVINFTNLATARASQRAREVALRKVLGANRRS